MRANGRSDHTTPPPQAVDRFVLNLRPPGGQTQGKGRKASLLHQHRRNPLIDLPDVLNSPCFLDIRMTVGVQPVVAAPYKDAKRGTSLVGSAPEVPNPVRTHGDTEIRPTTKSKPHLSPHFSPPH